MSFTPLSNIQEIIDRSIFQAIKQEVVDKGYCPDIASYPDTDIGVTQYNADLTAISNGPLKFAIEVFGASSTEAKKYKRIPRIVIIPLQNLPGALGGSNDKIYVKEGNKLRAEYLPPQTTDLTYDIHLVSKNAQQSRILSQLLGIALPKRGYIKVKDTENCDRIFVHNYTFRKFENTELGIIENIYSYRVPDIFEIANAQDTGRLISKITEITVEQKLIKTSLADSEVGPSFVTPK